ncbi:NADPH-dependent 7-cyano-7-deazaguanine reductase QueF [Halosquirtibacter xylanolyticus]|uniref:NADPH-dependent 7-cyano-7-deazaguanine reductase QueF n=1 Tax=Halosquirtibacter xylanolyticus TaxID=3374599 RepID=UPI00374A0B44|nr:NADPH-dependent 7-cyano-7-deazaguanine reductase QueF [Prolixibacteraceae bacterium]
MEINFLEAKVLGQKVSHPKEYDRTVLVAIPRSLNRTIYDIEQGDLPFVGFDAWHGYELSFLTEKGMPVVGVLKMVVPSDTPSLVESKSLKLYLNSFNMSRYGKSVKEGVAMVEKMIERDLSSLLEATVSVCFHTKERFVASPFKEHEMLEQVVDVDRMEIASYTEDASLLEVVDHDRLTEAFWGTDLLRSNCKVTFQPDWGSVYIHIEGEKLVSKASLLSYIVSMRNENHFHEEICELIYIRLKRLLNPQKLMVGCVYTRRGGIDICPFRANDKSLLPSNYEEAARLVQKTMRQ